MTKEKSGLFTNQLAYKPFRYPWAFEAWKLQQQLHWLPEEVPMAEDVKDWNHNLTKEEKNLLTQILRFFTQGDICVGDAYLDKYIPLFKPIEVRMMLTCFASVETIHVAAYAHLLETLGFPDVEFEAFMKYSQMVEKNDYFSQFNMDNPREIAKTMAVYAAFTEGLQLFASFAMLLNFPRFGKMKGMGQIVTWSVRDESLHCEGIIKLFRTFIQEHYDIWTDDLKAEIYQACRDVVEHEDAFIDLAFELGGVQGMTARDVKEYIRYMADRRLLALGLKANYGVKENPLPWMDEILNGVEFANFFEQRSTEYSKAATTGTWEEAYEDFEEKSYIVYSKDNCPYCVSAKTLLEAKKLPHTIIDVSDDAERQALYDRTGMRTVPVIFCNDKLIGGFDKLKELLIK